MPLPPQFHDRGRNHLVTRFICGQCGGSINLTNKKPSEPIGEPEGDVSTPKVVQDVYVLPCTTCYGEAIAPLQALRSAMKALDEPRR